MICIFEDKEDTLLSEFVRVAMSSQIQMSLSLCIAILSLTITPRRKFLSDCGTMLNTTKTYTARFLLRLPHVLSTTI